MKKLLLGVLCAFVALPALALPPQGIVELRAVCAASAEQQPALLRQALDRMAAEAKATAFSQDDPADVVKGVIAQQAHADKLRRNVLNDMTVTRVACGAWRLGERGAVKVGATRKTRHSTVLNESVTMYIDENGYISGYSF